MQESQLRQICLKMNSNILLFLFILYFFATLVTSEVCNAIGLVCSWDGSSPKCGETSANIGDCYNGSRLIAWTKEDDIITLNERIGNCKSVYGNGCWSGYKRLWCTDPSCPSSQ
ncbi:unnamed protein product [Cunninghamella echinulata]